MTGIIDGNSINEVDGLIDKWWARVSFPFGEPSDKLLYGKLDGQQLLLLVCRILVGVKGLKDVAIRCFPSAPLKGREGERNADTYIFSFMNDNYLIDIGTPEDYERTQSEMVRFR